jgi:hypothetical protein
MSHPTPTDQLSQYVYATAPTGDHTSYEVRTDGQGTAMLIAHRDDDSRPSSVDWHDVQWSRQQTSDWGDMT